MSQTRDFDLEAMITVAIDQLNKTYNPYSKYPVCLIPM